MGLSSVLMTLLCLAGAAVLQGGGVPASLYTGQGRRAQYGDVDRLRARGQWQRGPLMPHVSGELIWHS